VEGPNKEVRVEKRVRMIPKAWRGEVGVEGKEVGEYLKTKVPYPSSASCLNGRLLKWDICWIYHHSRDCMAHIVQNVHYHIRNIRLRVSEVPKSLVHSRHLMRIDAPVE
jgi:hypothetical protein